MYRLAQKGISGLQSASLARDISVVFPVDVLLRTNRVKQNPGFSTNKPSWLDTSGQSIYEGTPDSGVLGFNDCLPRSFILPNGRSLAGFTAVSPVTAYLYAEVSRVATWAPGASVAEIHPPWVVKLRPIRSRTVRDRSSKEFNMLVPSLIQTSNSSSEILIFHVI